MMRSLFFFNFYSLSRNGLAQLADNSHGHGFLKSLRKIVYNWKNSWILIQRFCNNVTTVNTCLLKATAVHSTWCLFLKFCALMAKIQTSQKKSCFYGIKFENLKPWRRGALGYIRNRKTEGKNHPKPQNQKKNWAKTENRIQNRQKPIQW